MCLADNDNKNIHTYRPFLKVSWLYIDRIGGLSFAEINKNREFYKNHDVRPPFTYASLIRQVRNYFFILCYSDLMGVCFYHFVFRLLWKPQTVN